MLSHKPRRCTATPQPAISASRVVDRPRAAAADRRVRALTDGHRSATQRSKRAARGARLGGRGTFPPCKPLKTYKTELETGESSPFGGPNATAATISPAEAVATPRPSSASFAGKLRGGEIFPSAPPSKGP